MLGAPRQKKKKSDISFRHCTANGPITLFTQEVSYSGGHSVYAEVRGHERSVYARGQYTL